MATFPHRRGYDRAPSSQLSIQDLRGTRDLLPTETPAWTRLERLAADLDPSQAHDQQVRAALQARGLDAEAMRQMTGRVLGERLGLLVRRVLQAHPLQRLLLSGGDTSSAIGRVLDVQAVEMAAALTPGAPLCRVLESAVVPGMEIAFKGGQMGGADFFREARDGSAR